MNNVEAPVWVYQLNKRTKSVVVLNKMATIYEDGSYGMYGNSCRKGGCHYWSFKPTEINSALSLRTYPFRLCLTERNDELAIQLFNSHLDRMTKFWDNTIDYVTTHGVEVRR